MSCGSENASSEGSKKLQLREDHLQNVQSLCASIQSEQRKRSVVGGSSKMATAVKKGRGQRSTYKIKLGWQNYRDGKYRVVTKAKGGETRMMYYTFGESLAVDRIRNQALSYYFPDGESNIGSVEDYDFSLALASGKIIESFTDVDNNPCNFTEFLQANGLYASQCHIYLRSKKKENKSFMINGVPIEKSDRTINIRYSKIKHSLYSEEQSEIISQSILQCFDVSGSPEKDEYDPFEDGYLVSRLEVQNTVFLERDGNVYNCPEALSQQQFVLNGPNQIFGFEVDDSNCLVLGAITIAHNNYIYKWLKNGNLFCSGMNRCVVKVTESGSYHVTVVSNVDSSTQGMSDTVKVDVVTPSVKTQNINKAAQMQTIFPDTHSQIINPDRKIDHKSIHCQTTSPVLDPQIEPPALQSQIISPVRDPQIEPPALHSQIISPVLDPQIEPPALHSKIISPVVDPQIEPPALHSEIISPVLDPQIEPPVWYSQIIHQDVEPQIELPALHSQIISPDVNPKIKPPALHSQIMSPDVDSQIEHTVLHFKTISPVVDPQIEHPALHFQTISPTDYPQIEHPALHSQISSPVVDPQIKPPALHFQVISPDVDPQMKPQAVHSKIISPVVDFQIEHTAFQLQVVGKPA